MLCSGWDIDLLHCCILPFLWLMGDFARDCFRAKCGVGSVQIKHEQHSPRADTQTLIPCMCQNV